MTTSMKVKKAIESQGRKKNWLASILGVSRPYLDKRLRDNYWTTGQVELLKEYGVIE